MQQQTIAVGSKLGDANTSVMGTSDDLYDDDSCCNESDILYHILGDDSNKSLDGDRSQDGGLQGFTNVVEAETCKEFDTAVSSTS